MRCPLGARSETGAQRWRVSNAGRQQDTGFTSPSGEGPPPVRGHAVLMDVLLIRTSIINHKVALGPPPISPNGFPAEPRCRSPATAFRIHVRTKEWGPLLWTGSRVPLGSLLSCLDSCWWGNTEGKLITYIHTRIWNLTVTAKAPFCTAVFSPGAGVSAHPCVTYQIYGNDTRWQRRAFWLVASASLHRIDETRGAAPVTGLQLDVDLLYVFPFSLWSN